MAHTVANPDVKAILVLDQREGKRVSAKYYCKKTFPDLKSEAAFEAEIHKKTKVNARAEPQLLLLDSACAAYRASSSGGVIFYVVGGVDENELILVHVLEGLYAALASLLKFQVEKMVLVDNIELLLLVVDEVVDSGVILETDPTAIESRVLMKGAVPESMSSYSEITLSSAIATARDKLTRSFLK